MLLSAICIIGVIWYLVHQRRKAARASEGEPAGAGSVGLNGALVDPHR